ncbi:MAG: type II toxin-antitoxin system VapB family antitoxin [Bosea sp. (in: a-proteobacteria)]
MALHIKDPETDIAVRKLAALWGMSITETVKASVEAHLRETRKATPLADRTRALRETLRAMPDVDKRSVKTIRDDWSNGI